MMIAITGKSGSGKSTLLNILLGLIILFFNKYSLKKNLLSEKSEYLFNFLKKWIYPSINIYL